MFPTKATLLVALLAAVVGLVALLGPSALSLAAAGSELCAAVEMWEAKGLHTTTLWRARELLSHQQWLGPLRPKPPLDPLVSCGLLDRDSGSCVWPQSLQPREARQLLSCFEELVAKAEEENGYFMESLTWSITLVGVLTLCGLVAARRRPTPASVKRKYSGKGTFFTDRKETENGNTSRPNDKEPAGVPQEESDANNVMVVSPAAGDFVQTESNAGENEMLEIAYNTADKNDKKNIKQEKTKLKIQETGGNSKPLEAFEKKPAEGSVTSTSKTEESKDLVTEKPCIKQEPSEPAVLMHNEEIVRKFAPPMSQAAAAEDKSKEQQSWKEAFVTVQVSVPYQSRKHVIGRGGATIQELQMAYPRVRVSVPPPEDTTSDFVTLRGPKSQVTAAAWDMTHWVRALLEELPESQVEFRQGEAVTLQLPVPADRRQHLIGRRGVTLRRLLRDCPDVRVTVPPCEDTTCGHVTLQGPREQVATVARHITVRLEAVEAMIQATAKRR